MRNALDDIDGAIKYILDGQNEHPNRIDVCKAKGTEPLSDQSTLSTSGTASSFGRSLSTTPAFGQEAAPSSFGRPPTSAFRQPSAPTSMFGQAPGPTFGQPSAPTSTFGQPSVQNSMSGQASGPTFGQQSAQNSTFGQPSFGQPSAFNRPTTSFGQPSTTFEQPSMSNAAFGQPSSSSPFSNQPTSMPAPTQLANPFRQAAGSSQPLAFGKPSSQQQTEVFGKPSATNAGLFAQPASQQATEVTAQNSAAPRNPFATAISSSSFNTVDQNSNGEASRNPFGPARFSQPAGTIGENSSASGPRATVVNGTTSSAAQIQKDNQGKVKVWNGKAVSYMNGEPCYRGSDGDWRRIWFPDGAPSLVNSESLPDTAYDGPTKENYDFVKANGCFKDGVMPLVPPKREWCGWNL